MQARLPFETPNVPRTPPPQAAPAELRVLSEAAPEFVRHPRGHICLNWRLVAMPDWVRDYVLLHELMHLKRMDHSPRFWKLVARVCPTFQEARTWLRQHQALLEAR